MLSNTAQYALRAILYVAERKGDTPVRVGQVAGALGIPRNYLSKILHELTRAGLLRSTRGKYGGFQLARPASHIPLLAVIARFDAMGEGRCLLGRAHCSDERACAVHLRWQGIGGQVTTFFRQTTLADLMSGRQAAA